MSALGAVCSLITRRSNRGLRNFRTRHDVPNAMRAVNEIIVEAEAEAEVAAGQTIRSVHS